MRGEARTAEVTIVILALSHKTLYSHTVRLALPEQADTLFDAAKPGDTLHSVAEFITSDELMNQLNANLQSGRFTKL